METEREATVVPPFEFGQKVYLATANAWYGVEKPCRLCFGELHVTIILGNGTQEKIACEACSHGCDGPSGTMREYEAHSSVVAFEVTGLDLDSEGWRVTGRVQSGRMSDGNLFAHCEQAEERRKVLHVQAEQQAEQQREHNMSTKKKRSAWSVSYHRSEIRRLKRDMEFHEKKLCLKLGAG